MLPASVSVDVGCPFCCTAECYSGLCVCVLHSHHLEFAQCACCRSLPLRLLPLQNSYGTGLTDWDNCSMYGKLALFIFAAWAGAEVRC
jgi:hypothetical protein